MRCDALIERLMSERNMAPQSGDVAVLTRDELHWLADILPRVIHSTPFCDFHSGSGQTLREVLEYVESALAEDGKNEKAQ